MSSEINTSAEFSRRHIGPNDTDIQLMLKELGFSTLDEMASKVIPKTIRSQFNMDIGEGISEFELLRNLKSIMSKNKVNRSLIGLGFHDTITPTVIQRNILENPVWYTAYTPYQAEIAQGRLEALLNFQTMIMDLTGMELANASLLDEGSAAAEAMYMAHSLSKNKSDLLLASPSLHPHVLEVLQTRAEPLGIELVLAEPESYNFERAPFAVIVGYPDTHGAVRDYSQVAQKCRDKGALLIVDADLLALTVLKAPGEWGADIVIGNSQRFGVPLGYGGPHAAFMATKDVYKRSMPGRLVGVSIDTQNNKALRLALQTREQHIRREKATSNICTAQVLLANMASMYAVYHGPKGLKNIATRVHAYAKGFASALKKAGFSVSEKNFFDTVEVKTDKADSLYQAALAKGFNLRRLSTDTLSAAFHEALSAQDMEELLQVFGTKFELPPAGDFAFDSGFVRTSSYLTHPVFNSHHSETELLRYIHSLQNKDLTLTHSMIPLGSCTMKLNATTELAPVSWPEVNRIHPFAPLDQVQGYMTMIKDLERKLCEITGFAAVSLQPNAGSQGEYAGLLAIRKYHQSRGESHRNICLIPSSAHGTNPASAVMAGMEVVVTACDENGNVDLNDLRAKAEQNKDKLACLMITYPSTHGVFEESIVEICQIIHSNGGQVYMDGANLNALVGLCQPGKFGPDVSHMNLHKTFAIPHGGGGPGVGPIGVAKHLAPFLPTHSLVKEAGPATGITATTSAPWGSASILPISWTYITLMGASGLRKATLTAILNANYIAKKLDPYYPVLYKGREGLVAHECILDLRPMKKNSDVDVTDVAKRLIDYGFHAPTMSFPVVGTLMVEPTESESKQELDRFVDAMIQIRKEVQAIETGKVDRIKNPLKNAPHTAEMVTSDSWPHPYTRTEAAYPLPWVRANKFWPAVGRIDNAYGDRNIVCSCPPVESYQ